MGETLPKEWKWVELSELVKDSQAGFACGERDPHGVIQIRMNNVNTHGQLDLNSFIRVPPPKNVYERYQLIDGDVLFNNTNSTELVGKSTVFREYTETVVYSNHFTRLRVVENRLNSEYLSRWLLWQWQSRIFEQLCNRWIGQSAVKNDKLLALKIPLPPLPEQKRIVDVLTDRLSTIDKARTATEAQLEAAKSLPAAYLRQVFDGPEAQKSRKTPLRSVCEFVGGMQPPKSTFQYEPLPDYIRLVQIQDFRRSDVAVYIPQEEAKRQFDQTDVMIGRYGPPVFQILRGLSGAYNVALMKTVPTENLLKDYLYYLLQEPGIQNAVINQSQRSAGQSGVQKEFLEQFGVFVPSIDKQQKIVEMLSDKFLAIKLLKQSLQSQLNTINKLPAALLRQAFNGEL